MKYKDLLKIDYLLLLPVLILLVLGILYIYSSGITHEGNLVSNEYLRQIIWASVGLIVSFILSMVNYRKFYNIAIYIYIFSLIPLLYTVVFGKVVFGAARWLRIGIFGGQMSEFIKITVIILLARFLADTDHNKKTFSRFIASCIIVGIPMFIVLLQPDLGTAMVYLAILITMVFLSGVSMRYITFMIACIALTGLFLVLPLWQTHIWKKSMPFMALLTSPRILTLVVLFFAVIAAIALFGYLKYKKKYFYWIVYIPSILIISVVTSFAARLILKQYQLMRLIVFLDPNVDPRGAGWNIIQSMTAIGAGGLTGMGYLQGTQSHYRFLPEQSTDFIFSIYSEETGFLGGLLIFAMFLLICFRIITTLKTTADPFGKYMCAGFLAMYSFHFIINVGMTMGIMPVTGLPLLFMSYGGSAVLSSMIGIGLLLSIYIRRFNR
ncbi:MAG: rod shape-determining protein RodA [Treponema sp.]|jgi:rod shape determining protein RodA|nr:rod shape-determining protein RodA [Treponema sp.]